MQFQHLKSLLIRHLILRLVFTLFLAKEIYNIAKQIKFIVVMALTCQVFELIPYEWLRSILDLQSLNLGIDFIYSLLHSTSWVLEISFPLSTTHLANKKIYLYKSNLSEQEGRNEFNGFRRSVRSIAVIYVLYPAYENSLGDMLHWLSSLTVEMYNRSQSGT